MTRPTPPCFPAPLTLSVLSLALAWPCVGPARAADLPFVPSPPPIYGAPAPGGGFRVARVPVRPAPLRYDIYGYPVFPGVPKQGCVGEPTQPCSVPRGSEAGLRGRTHAILLSPLAVGDGCPVAVQPDYDPDGNFAGYAPLPLCR